MIKRRQYADIKKLVSLCWEIRRAYVEGGDISAGQFLGKEFDQFVDDASRAMGQLVICSPEDDME